MCKLAGTNSSVIRTPQVEEGGLRVGPLTAWLLANRPTFFNANKAGAWRFEPDAAAAGGDDAGGGDGSDDEELSGAELVDADPGSSDGEFGDDDDDGMSDC